MARMRIPCYGCRTPLLVDDHDLGFRCPQCQLSYVVEHDRGILTLVTTGERRDEPSAISEEPKSVVGVQPAEPAGVQSAAPVGNVAPPSSRGSLVASVLTIGMIIGLCGGVVGGLGLAAVVYATLIRPG